MFLLVHQLTPSQQKNLLAKLDHDDAAYYLMQHRYRGLVGFKIKDILWESYFYSVPLIFV